MAIHNRWEIPESILGKILSILVLYRPIQIKVQSNELWTMFHEVITRLNTFNQHAG